MLEHLIKYGEQAGLAPEPGFAVKWVKWAIVCKAGGKYLGITQLGDTDLGNRNPGMEFLKAPNLTTYQITGGPKNCRHFLADPLGMVTMLDKAEPLEKDLAKHEFFKDLLRQAAKQAPELSGLAKMLGDQTILEKINRDLADSGAKPTEIVSFLVGGKYPLDSASWHEWWKGWWQEHCPLKLGDEPMVDMLSGEEAHPMLSHYKISGLASVGGQPTGDSLASFNKGAFQSYGLEASANAAFSPQSVIAYVEPLNHLIRHHSRILAGVKVVHWYKDKLAPEEEDPLDSIWEGQVDEELDALQAQALARKFLDDIRAGTRTALRDNRYYAMILSGAAGRVMMRDWMEGSFEELVLSINTWFDQMSIVRKDGAGLSKRPKLSAVLAATVRDLDDIKAPQVAGLYRCAIGCGQPFPLWALAKTVLRSKADVLRGESPRYNRMGLLKAWLMRNPNTKGGDQLSPYLNEDHPEAAYQCGRLMAVYANLQRSALGDVGAGVVQRYYAAASVTPALILGKLARLSQFHLNKLKGGLTHWYEDRLASVWERIDSELPATLDLEDQSLFALGYYQQLAEMRRPKKKQDDKTAQSGDKE